MTLLDGRWDKNDTKDSANVADLISQGREYPRKHKAKPRRYFPQYKPIG